MSIEDSAINNLKKKVISLEYDLNKERKKNKTLEMENQRKHKETELDDLDDPDDEIEASKASVLKLQVKLTFICAISVIAN